VSTEQRSLDLERVTRQGRNTARCFSLLSQGELISESAMKHSSRLFQVYGVAGATVLLTQPLKITILNKLV